MLRPANTPAILRDRLRTLIATHNDSMAAISRRLGKRNGYLRDLLLRTDDTWLAPRDAEFLERYFGLRAGELTPD